MYTYLLIAIVILFTLFKYDIKESMKIDIEGNPITLDAPASGAKGGDMSNFDWSKYVLKSTITPCPTAAGALQFSADTDFKSIEDCYSKNKPPGDSLKWRDFVKCINKKHPSACPSPVAQTVQISGSGVDPKTVVTAGKKELNFFENLFNKIFN